jgi:hypothetical protein
MRRVIELLVAALLLVGAVPAASAGDAIYIAINPDSRFCDTVVFGNQGKGEYTLDIEDPGYPERPWVNIHRASFDASPTNTVIIPLCFSTKGRKRGQEAVLNFNLETPEGNITFDYGICVSDFEDIDVGISGENPCRATSARTDIFSMDLLETSVYAKPGESVTVGLLVSSDMDLTVTLDKVSGPSISIGKTTVELPGQENIALEMTAPETKGTYDFTISGKVSGCDNPSCEKSVTGNLHVTDEREGFTVRLSPETKNVIGTSSATYFLTIDNLGGTGKFKIVLETDSSIETDFKDMETTIAGGTKRALAIVVVPRAADNRVHKIKVSAENEKGVRNVAEASLTIDEALSDVKRMAENNPNYRNDADDYADVYDSGGLEEWEDINDLIIRDDGISGPAVDETPGINWIIWVAAAGVIAAVGGYYIYRKTKVTNELSSDAYQPLDA